MPSSEELFDWGNKFIDQFGTDASPEMRQQLIMSMLKTLPPHWAAIIFPMLQKKLNDQPLSTFTGHRFYFADSDCSDSDLAHINAVLVQAVKEDKVDVAIRQLRSDEYIIPIGNQSAKLHEELHKHYGYTKSSKTISRMALEPLRSVTA